MDLSVLENHELQNAIGRNRVTFPSQAPAFPRQSRFDIQWRLAVLYFVRRWSLGDIARLYGLSRERAGQILKGARHKSAKTTRVVEVVVAHALCVPRRDSSRRPASRRDESRGGKHECSRHSHPGALRRGHAQTLLRFQPLELKAHFHVAHPILKARRILSIKYGYIQEIPEDPSAQAEPEASAPNCQLPALRPGAPNQSFHQASS